MRTGAGLEFHVCGSKAGVSSKDEFSRQGKNAGVERAGGSAYLLSSGSNELIGGRRAAPASSGLSGMEGGSRSRPAAPPPSAVKEAQQRLEQLFKPQQSPSSLRRPISAPLESASAPVNGTRSPAANETSTQGTLPHAHRPLSAGVLYSSKPMSATAPSGSMGATCPASPASLSSQRPLGRSFSATDAGAPLSALGSGGSSGGGVRGGVWGTGGRSSLSSSGASGAGGRVVTGSDRMRPLSPSLTRGIGGNSNSGSGSCTGGVQRHSGGSLLSKPAMDTGRVLGSILDLGGAPGARASSKGQQVANGLSMTMPAPARWQRSLTAAPEDEPSGGSRGSRKAGGASGASRTGRLRLGPASPKESAAGAGAGMGDAARQQRRVSGEGSSAATNGAAGAGNDSLGMGPGLSPRPLGNGRTAWSRESGASSSGSLGKSLDGYGLRNVLRGGVAASPALSSGQGSRESEWKAGAVVPGRSGGGKVVSGVGSSVVVSDRSHTTPRSTSSRSGVSGGALASAAPDGEGSRLGDAPATGASDRSNVRSSTEAQQRDMGASNGSGRTAGPEQGLVGKGAGGDNLPGQASREPPLREDRGLQSSEAPRRRASGGPQHQPAAYATAPAAAPAAEKLPAQAAGALNAGASGGHGTASSGAARAKPLSIDLSILIPSSLEPHGAHGVALRQVVPAAASQSSMALHGEAAASVGAAGAAPGAGPAPAPPLLRTSSSRRLLALGDDAPEDPSTTAAPGAAAEEAAALASPLLLPTLSPQPSPRSAAAAHWRQRGSTGAGSCAGAAGRPVHCRWPRNPTLPEPGTGTGSGDGACAGAVAVMPESAIVLHDLQVASSDLLAMVGADTADFVELLVAAARASRRSLATQIL